MVHSDLDVNTWIETPPSVERARPKQCPCCGKAGWPAGAGLGLWGHGVRARQVRGPRAPGQSATVVTIEARRYQCRGCGAIVTVLPRGLVARRHYAAAAIGLALLLVGVLGKRLLEVRRRVCAWQSSFEAGEWAEPRRWLRAIEQGGLFAALRASPPEWTMRQRAERAAMTLVAMAPPPVEDMEAAVMLGAAQAA